MEDEQQNRSPNLEKFAESLDAPTGTGRAQKEPTKSPETESPATANPPSSSTGGKPPEGALSAEAINKLVEERVQKALQSHIEGREAAGTRDQFIQSKMLDLPVSARKLMPVTGDMKQLAQAEQSIRAEFREWFGKALDAEVKAGRISPRAGVGGDNPGGHPPSAAAKDWRKLSPTDRLAQSLESHNG